MRQILYFLFLLVFIASCAQSSQDMKKAKQANDLINESSPYLLQHAYNPVNWKPWGEDALQFAKEENKLMVISIGYSSCHWCHVMEEESFEDDAIAEIMNSNYVNIKVDREERPDIDQIYMDAIQLMSGRGGWPLNVIALPDGRPVYAGTYHTKSQWRQILLKMEGLYKKEPEKLREYASQVTQGIANYNLIEVNEEEAQFTKSLLDAGVDNQIDFWDRTLGGNRRAPKFPLPNSYEYLLRYGFQNSDDEVLEYVETTLDKMAFGGIYDQIGGGFSRYSTDKKWHIPHFEKMLYDNAQLVELYSKAYTLTKKELYKNVVEETLAFIERELMSADGAFYSSLDADSENSDGELEEGAFYAWKRDELKGILNDNFDLFSKYFNVNSFGLWEDGNYVLIRKNDLESFASEQNVNKIELESEVKSWKQSLLEARNSKNRPRLDDKILTSWNGLMLKGFVEAYKAFQKPHYLEIAIGNGNFIIQNQLKNDGGLWHNHKDGISTINGYLEDYAAVIDGFIALYTVTANEEWLNRAVELTEYCFEHFYNENNGFFYFTSNEDNELISRKADIVDNVIPASNSMMAHNIFRLSHYFNNKEYKEAAIQMLNNVKPQMTQSPASFSNWYLLMADMVGPFYEVAISGDNALDKMKTISNDYLPNIMLAVSKNHSDIPLMQNRYNEENTYIYVCVDGTCRLPQINIDNALKQIRVEFAKK